MVEMSSYYQNVANSIPICDIEIVVLRILSVELVPIYVDGVCFVIGYAERDKIIIIVIMI